MPRQFNTRLKSLQECCVDYVANNVEWWCVEQHGESKLDDHLDGDGPFDSLPSIFLEQIIGVLGKKKLLKRQHLKLLVTSQLKTLNIIHWGIDWNDTVLISQILHLTSIRCSQLTAIRWHRCYKELPITMLFATFQKLQQLHVSNTETGDSFLVFLGTYCKELRVLDVEECSAVTDAGIKGLCAINFDESKMGIQTPGQCKSIHTLKIRNTGVTKKGIQLALENLPALRVFEFDSTVQILAELHEECNFPNYQLVSLVWTDVDNRSLPYKSGSLGLVASLSSSLNKVHIATIPGLTDQGLLGLLNINSLCDLAILGKKNWNFCEITFDGGVVPLLKKFGKSLTSFSLQDVYRLRVNIRAIVEYCPNLESLFLIDSGDYVTAPLDKEQPPSKQMKKELILKNLKRLIISCNSEDCEISSECLDMLLSSPDLVKLIVEFCDAVNDRILRKAFDLHQFRNLQTLWFICCGTLTKEGIYLLMNEKNSLSDIRIQYCDLLTDEFAEEIVSFARQKNWDVNITHCVL